MATRSRKDAAIEAALAREVDTAEPDYIDYETLNPALEQIKADLSITGDADVDCHVSKLNFDGNGTEGKVWTGDPDSFDLEKIAKTHGSGQYRIMVYMKIPSGHKVRKLNKVQAWLLSPADEAKVVAARNPPEVKQGDSNALASVMVQGFQQLGELIVKATQKPEVDSLAQMEKMAGIFRQMMPPAQANAQPGLMEMLNMVKLFNEATGANAPKLPEGTDSSTALMMAGMEMFKPIVQKAIEQKSSQVATPINGQPMLPPPGSNVPVAASDESEEFMLFKLQLKAANKMASAGRDVADFAETAYAMLPDEVLHGMAFDPNWFAYLVKAVPECEAHQAWYAAVRDAIVNMAVEDEVFVRNADGSLTLPVDPAQNAVDSKGPPNNVAGTKSAAA